MPAKLDRCVRRLMRDKKFKPKNPKQSKESAAWAVCTAQLQNIERSLKIISDIQKTLKEKI